MRLHNVAVHIFLIRVARQKHLAVSYDRLVMPALAVIGNQFLQRFKVKIAVVTLKFFYPVVIKLFEKVSAIELYRSGKQLSGSVCVVASASFERVCKQALELFCVNLVLI